jgi:hypothetical protein
VTRRLAEQVGTFRKRIDRPPLLNRVSPSGAITCRRHLSDLKYNPIANSDNGGDVHTFTSIPVAYITPTPTTSPAIVLGVTHAIPCRPALRIR